MAKDKFSQVNDNYENIMLLINKTIKQKIYNRLMIFDNIAYRESSDLLQFTLNVGADNKGFYLSQQQIDLLIITELASKEQIEEYFYNWCSQFPNRAIEDVLEGFYTLDLTSSDVLEDIKRKLYDAYLDTLDNYDVDAAMSLYDRIISKFKKLGIDEKRHNEILSLFKEKGFDVTLQELVARKGLDERTKFIMQFNRLMRDDFENVKSVNYDEMKALSRLIKLDKSMDTLIIATSKYDNVVYSNGTNKYFDPYFTQKAMKYCEKHNLHMRYHALFDYAHIETLLKQGKTAADKEEILANMKNYVQASMRFIEENNRTLADGTKLINVIEVFNELVEKNKTDDDKKKPYAMKWEKEFGITIQDLLSCFEGIKKPEGVSFMYNETTLTESSAKRMKVEEVLGQIERLSPGFIDAFGDQAHLSEEDLFDDSREIKETVELLKRIADGNICVGKNGNGENIYQNIGHKNVEITEHDFHFSKNFIHTLDEYIAKGIIKKDDIKLIKKNMQDKIAALYKNSGINFGRLTSWSIFNKNDHNLVRANKKIIENKTNEPLVLNMYAGTLDDGLTIEMIDSLFSKKTLNKEDENDKDKKDLSVSQEETFDVRSDEEIKLAEQIRNKNRMIVEEQKKVQEKGPVLKKTPPINHGYISIIALIFIISFIVGIIVSFVFFVIR